MRSCVARHVLPLAIVCLLCVGASGVTGPRADSQVGSGPGTPVVANGSFEDLDGPVPRGWRATTWRKSVEFAVDPSVAHTGSRSVRIGSRDGGDGSWSIVVPVTPYARYRLSGWIRTEQLEPGSGKGALLNLHNLQPLQTAPVTGTRDWTRVVLEFDTEANDAVQINCLFGGWGRATGAAWFDDVSLELLAARTLRPSVTIDVASTRDPMSKYIYGQFIEHLGRCIYGGIWAEMLEDRKFHHAVGAPGSPWTAIGDGTRVTMSRERPLAGEHSPEVRLGGGGTEGGITQGGLAVIAGKRYTGRVVLAGDAAAAPVTVRLVWGDTAADQVAVTVATLGPGFETTMLELVAGGASDDARLEIASRGSGTFRVGAVSLMPADHVEGFRPDTLALLRELDAPVYRWPGGNFVSGYNWRDGIGDRDRRPPRKNPAWQGIEHNDVGIHEFMALCRLIGAEPYIAVNSGLGEAGAAADQVEYVNGTATTPMGRLRASNGHAEPFGCRYWSIGNEMYGDWQLGHMPTAEYVAKHIRFAEAMRARDPSISLVAVGAVGEWDETMLSGAGRHMDLISEHFYVQEAPGLLGHVGQVPREIRRIAEAHRRYRTAIPALEGRDIRIALDEWNYWYGPHIYGELGTQYFLKDALGVAAGIHEYSRQTDIIFMANYAQTVNVIGAIKTSRTAAILDTTGMVLKLYRARFGTIPVEVLGAPEPLDVAAAWTDGRKALTLAVVNPTRAEHALALKMDGVSLPQRARLWRIAGTDERACNVPGRPPAVAIVESPSETVWSTVRVPPLSVSIFEMAMEGRTPR